VEKKKKNRAGRMGFSSIQKTASTGSSATGALVGANSLQPVVQVLQSGTKCPPAIRVVDMRMVLSNIITILRKSENQKTSSDI